MALLIKGVSLPAPVEPWKSVCPFVAVGWLGWEQRLA